MFVTVPLTVQLYCSYICDRCLWFEMSGGEKERKKERERARERERENHSFPEDGNCIEGVPISKPTIKDRISTMSIDYLSVVEKHFPGSFPLRARVATALTLF